MVGAAHCNLPDKMLLYFYLSLPKFGKLQRGQQPRTAVPNASISPFGFPFDKIYPKTAHSAARASHTILG